MGSLETGWDKAGPEISTFCGAVLDWMSLLGGSWEVVGKLLLFGGRRENAEMSNAFSLMGEMCLGSIVLPQNEDIVGSAPSFTRGAVRY